MKDTKTGQSKETVSPTIQVAQERGVAIPAMPFMASDSKPLAEESLSVTAYLQNEVNGTGR
jgi:hypothetical protein